MLIRDPTQPALLGASALTLSLLLACAEAPPEPPTAPPRAATPLPVTLPIDGSCAPIPGDDPQAERDTADTRRAYSPRAALPESEYDLRLFIPPNSLGSVRLRSRLSFDAQDLRNLLGHAPTNTIVAARGPMKNAPVSMGIGYAVRVRDRQGLECEGYVSGTVIERLTPYGEPRTDRRDDPAPEPPTPRR
jgi:hypothetical protein